MNPDPDASTISRAGQACLTGLATLALMAAPQWAGAADAAVLGYSPANMDKRGDPRQDFYRYAAGNWLSAPRSRPANPTSAASPNSPINLDKQLLKLIKDTAATQGGARQPAPADRRLLAAAMDVKRLDAVGHQAAAGRPRPGAALPLPGHQRALGELSGRLQMAYGGSPLVNAVVATDAKNSSTNLLMIVAGQQSLDLDEYAKPENQRVRDLYLAYIASDVAAARACRRRTPRPRRAPSWRSRPRSRPRS